MKLILLTDSWIVSSKFYYKPALKAESPLTSNKSVIKSLKINLIRQISPVIKLSNDTENIKIETLYLFSNKKLIKFLAKMF